MQPRCSRPQHHIPAVSQLAAPPPGRPAIPETSSGTKGFHSCIIHILKGEGGYKKKKKKKSTRKHFPRGACPQPDKRSVAGKVPLFSTKKNKKQGVFCKTWLRRFESWLMGRVCSPQSKGQDRRNPGRREMRAHCPTPSGANSDPQSTEGNGLPTLSSTECQQVPGELKKPPPRSASGRSVLGAMLSPSSQEAAQIFWEKGQRG